MKQITELRKLPSEIIDIGMLHDDSTDQLDELYSLLYRYGFKKIGGISSRAWVYEHPNFDYILKTFSDDVPYIQFYNYCKKNHSNPHLPKFRGNLMRFRNSEMYAVRIEKLLKLNDREYLNNIELLLFMWVKFDYSSSGSFNILRDKVKKLTDLEKNKIVDDYSKTLMGKTIIDLSKIYSKFDLHVDNIMKRNDGTFVIIDPFLPA